MSAPFSASSALEQEQRVSRRVARDRLRASSHAMPLGLFGVLSIVAAIIAARGEFLVLGVFWATAGPLGGIAIAVSYARRDLRLPFETPPASAMVATAAGMIVAALLIGWLGGGAAVYFAISGGYVLFAVATGNGTTARVAAAIFVLAVVATADDALTITGAGPALAAASLTAAVGAVQLLGAGAEIRRTRSAPAPAAERDRG